MTTQSCYLLTIVYMVVLFLEQSNGDTGAMAATYNNKRIKVGGGDDPTRPPCPSKGIFLESVNIQIEDNDDCIEESFKILNYSLKLNQIEKDLLTSITRECNGKHQCKLKDTWTFRPNISCAGNVKPVETIGMSFRCLPVSVNDIMVTELQVTQKTLTKNEHYLVHRAEKELLNIQCQLSGNGSQVKIRVLYLDLNSLEECNKNETNTMSLFIKESNITKSELNCSNSNYTNEVSIYNATIHIHFIGFIWTKVTVTDSATLTCSSNSTNQDSSNNKADTVIISATLVVAVVVIIIIGIAIFLVYRKTKKASSAKISVQRQVINTPTAEKNTNYVFLESQDIYMNNPLQADELSAMEHSPEYTTETKAISTLLKSENKNNPRLTSLQTVATKPTEFNHGEEYSHLSYSVDKKRYNLNNIYNM